MIEFDIDLVIFRCCRATKVTAEVAKSHERVLEVWASCPTISNKPEKTLLLHFLLGSRSQTH